MEKPIDGVEADIYLKEKIVMAIIELIYAKEKKKNQCSFID